VPVHVGGTYAHAKAVVEDLIGKKGWNTIRQDTGLIASLGR